MTLADLGVGVKNDPEWWDHPRSTKRTLDTPTKRRRTPKLDALEFGAVQAIAKETYTRTQIGKRSLERQVNRGGGGDRWLQPKVFRDLV